MFLKVNLWSFAFYALLNQIYLGLIWEIFKYLSQFFLDPGKYDFCMGTSFTVLRMFNGILNQIISLLNWKCYETWQIIMQKIREHIDLQLTSFLVLP